MGEYNDVQEEYRERCKDRIQRQLKYSKLCGRCVAALLLLVDVFQSQWIFAAGKRVTEDEVEDMLESDNPAIFTQDVRLLNCMQQF